MPSIPSNATTLYAELATAKTQFDWDKQPIEKKLTEFKTELKTVQNSYKTLEQSIRNEEARCEIPKALGKIYKDLLKSIKSVSGNDEVHLRLKNGNIKAQEYSGLNPFKKCGLGTGSYLRQGEALKKEYLLPSVKKGDVKKHLNDQLKLMADAIIFSNTEKGKLENKKNQLDIEINGLRKKIDSSNNDISKLRKNVYIKEYQIAQLKEKITKEIGSPPVNMGDFAAVYSTNAGYKAVQEALRDKKNVSISGSDVIGEIERRHGDDIFLSGAKKRAADLKFVAGEIGTYQTVEKVDKFIYASKLTAVENGMPGRSTIQFRSAFHTDAAVTMLKNAHGRRQLIKPEGLFSVSETKEAARAFGEGMKSKANTIFVVTGKSSHGFHSEYAVRSEQESVYSSYATFSVNSVKTDAKTGFNIVELTEEMMSFSDRRRSQVLSLPK